MKWPYSSLEQLDAATDRRLEHDALRAPHRGDQGLGHTEAPIRLLSASTYTGVGGEAA
jgi:hypothetical protein